VKCEINLPSSKSISNRLLIIKALCKEDFEIKNLSDSDDTIALQKAFVNITKTMDVGASGTTFRFLTAYLSTQVGRKFILTGTDRMKERPIKELVGTLQSLGAEIEYAEKEGFPPLRIKGRNLKGGKIIIDGTISSQFISALLLIAPTLKKGLNLKIEGEIVSKPYIKMTLKLMKEFGVDSSWNGNAIEVKPQNFIAKNFEVESDWSATSFWYEIAALSKSCNIKLNGLSENSIQGDRIVSELFNKLGVNSEIENNSLILTKSANCSFPKEIDLLEIPDLYQPLKCTLFAINNNPEITGTQTLKSKETDRIKAVEIELKKINTSKIIKTYKDHRMAMSFAPLCLKFGKIQINNTEVVSKSYPNFWKDLEKGGFKIVPLTGSNN
jgi:3-phosphoshikimate 1-carboxyvinyltransferase